jgi:DNA polymerase-2
LRCKASPVTCFGYLGYKNARFGRIEAHQAVTAYSRECLLQAKEAAEDTGFTVLHLYVDGLWVQRKNQDGSGKALTIQEVQPLLDEIAIRTGLPIALDGIYRWVAFLPSRIDARVPVANRYFGVFQDRSIKVRGIETRRHDTPPFIAQTQMALLECLAKTPNANQLSECLPSLIALLRRQIQLLRSGSVPIQDLVVTQKLSRELSLYRTPSPAARAAMQLQAAGKPVRPGQPIKLLYILGEPGVHAWDCPPAPSLAQLDIAIYMKLMLRAAEAVIQPLGISPDQLSTWVMDNARYLPEGRYPLFKKMCIT